MFNVMTSPPSSIKRGFYLLVGGAHRLVEPRSGAKLPKSSPEVLVGAARLQKRVHVQSGHVCRVFVPAVLISVMSCSFTALLMVDNKDYSQDISACETLSTLTIKALSSIRISRTV